MKQVGRYRVHQRQINTGIPVRRWKSYQPNMSRSWPEARLLEEIAPGRGEVPECHGIEIEGAGKNWCQGMEINSLKSKWIQEREN